MLSSRTEILAEAREVDIREVENKQRREGVEEMERKTWLRL